MAVTLRVWLLVVRGFCLAAGLLCVGVYFLDDMPILLEGMGTAALGVALTTWVLRSQRPPTGPVQDIAPSPVMIGQTLMPIAPTARLDEWEILRAAEARQGRVTPIEIAADTESPMATAQQGLEDLQKKGACTLEISESGQLVYCFADFINPEAKDQLI